MKKNISRRDAIRVIAIAGAATLVSCMPKAETPEPTSLPTAIQPLEPTTVPPTNIPQSTSASVVNSIATIYMTADISADGLLKVYQALGSKPNGKVALKIHSGEPGGNNYVPPELLALLVKEVNGTLVESNVAYWGPRSAADTHRKVMEDHGFAAIAPVDILDAEGTMSIPITGGKHLQEVVVGSHLAEYEFVINLAHFKGHDMAGFGGVIKNMSIGIASSMGKSLIHSAGKESTGFGMNTPTDEFLESMAEAAKGVEDHLGENIVHIDVMRKLSVDCDCLSGHADPTMNDICILASMDPVALDQACMDLVYAAPDGKDLIARMESRNGSHVLEHAEAIGLGIRNYELVTID